MQEGRKGRKVARLVVVMTIVATVVAGVAFFGEPTAQLAEILWTYSGQ